MAEPTKQPVVIEHESNTQKQTHHEKKSGYIKDSASRVQSIAQIYGLDALLQNEPPAKPALERAHLREQRRQEQRQKNLEQILKLAHSSCRDETAGEPDQDWLYRFFDMAQDIHNSSMQKLWAQVMKREVTNWFDFHESVKSAERHVTTGSPNPTKSRDVSMQLWWRYQ